MIGYEDLLDLEQGFPRELDIDLVKADLIKFNDILRVKKGFESWREIEKVNVSWAHLQLAIATVLNFLDPQVNTFINQDNKRVELLRVMTAQIGRWSGKIDTLIKESSNLMSETLMFYRLEQIKNMMFVAASGFVYNPLYRAKREYNKLMEDGAKPSKDLFGYFLFRDLLTSSDVFGILTRQDSSERKRSITEEAGLSSKYTLPAIPEGTEYMESANDPNYEAFFSESVNQREATDEIQF